MLIFFSKQTNKQTNKKKKKKNKKKKNKTKKQKKKKKKQQKKKTKKKKKKNVEVAAFGCHIWPYTHFCWRWSPRFLVQTLYGLLPLLQLTPVTTEHRRLKLGPKIIKNR